MNKIILFIILFFETLAFNAQVKGKVIDNNNEALPYVNVYLKNSLSGTVTNDNGFYEFNLKKTGKYTIIFQFLGFKTIEKTVNIQQFPFQLDIKMLSENFVLKEIEISSKENPANFIIKKVIANKEKNTNKSGKYTADFYSRGLFKIKNAPEKILGREMGDFGGGLDSTRSGIIYLSETVSKITYQKNPEKFKEIIIASKVSGENNEISFNRANEVNFNLYENQVYAAGANIFSPIANYAFRYYKYRLESTFYDKNGKLINKIKLTPKRENDPVFNGYLYIVEDDWAVYGSDLTISGSQISNPAIDILHLKQGYNYDEKAQVWALILQTIDFKTGLFGFKMDGRFSSTYANYNFESKFTKNTFTKEILSFKKDANNKDSTYWNTLRPVSLTSNEKNDYLQKDSLRILHSSKKYLDSVDIKKNTFKLSSTLLGYNYKNSHKKSSFRYKTPLLETRFNSVQGFNSSLKFEYSKRKNDIGNDWQTSVDFNYGFSEKTVRPLISFTKNWNHFTYPELHIEVGKKINQFDEREQIPSLRNTSLSLFFKDNFAKYFDKTFAKISFSEEIKNGFRFFTSLEYAHRKPLFNNTNFSIFRLDKDYTSNNPIDSPPFEEHRIFTTNIRAEIHFDNKYLSYPDSKFTIYNQKYPTLHLNYRKNIGVNNSNLNADFLFARLNQNISLATLGDFNYDAKVGTFLKKRDIAFIDYYHPLANQTLLAPIDRQNAFSLLAYYQLNTNDAFAEVHTEHRFKGFLLNRIPLLNKLKLEAIITAKSYFTSGNRPYTEFGIGLDNIGWGKWRFFRLDYVQSYHNGNKENGFILGVNFF